MKRVIGLLLCSLLLIICAIAMADVEINKTNFPDDDFRDFLLDNTDYTSEEQTKFYTDVQIAAIKRIDCTKKGISTLKGIEYFTALTDLDCGHNQLTELNISSLGNLTGLAADGNWISSLNVTSNTSLTFLSLSGNQLKSIDVSKNTALKRLSCISNPMKTVDISNCPALCNLVQAQSRQTDEQYHFDFWKDSNDEAYLDVNMDTKVIAGNFVSSPTVVLKPIESVTITMTAPIAGSNAGTLPVVTLPSDAHYILNKNRCHWMDETGQLFEDHVFIAGEVGRVLISLTPEEGYEFIDSPEISVINGDIDPDFGSKILEPDLVYFMATVKVAEAAATPPEAGPQDQSQTEIPASVSLSKTKLTIKDGATKAVTATLANPADSIASVKSSKTKVAKVKFSGNDILITPNKEAGKTTITVTTVKGATAKIEVTVKASVSLNEKKITLKKNKTFKIKVVSIPSGVKATKFVSSKPGVATVDNSGKVKGIKKGSAVITVTLNNQKELKLKVTVK